MSLILNIDTATETAQVNFAKDGRVLQFLTNTMQKDHAAFVQTAIQQLLSAAPFTLKDIDAVAVTSGPGSYTGLRVGMASAKGICYALNKPLILVNMLEVLATSIQQKNDHSALLFCPMIDARRMEVFTAIYDYSLNTKMEPCALILQENSFLNYLENNKIISSGSGLAKWKAICTHPNALFSNIYDLAPAMAGLSFNYFLQPRFSNLAYSEPNYLKEFKDYI
jgi:tRNA threonylcarbamoyladenosine biosynthesis protein TsaB